MRLCSIRGTRVTAHPFLPLSLLMPMFVGSANAPAALLSLVVHEAGHYLAALCMRVRVEEIELTPFGGVMTMPGLPGETRARAAVLAAAGPVFSLLACAFSTALAQWGVLTAAQARPFFRASVVLLLINCLPALPLDGGRVLSALLPHSAKRALAIAGGVVSAALCALSLASALRGAFTPAPALAGVYLAYAGALERRQSGARCVHAVIGRREKLARGDVLRAQSLAARSDTPLYRIAFHLTPGAYHTVSVLDADGLTALGTLDERALCGALMSLDAQATLGDALAKNA